MKIKFLATLFAVAGMILSANAQVNGPDGIKGGTYDGAQKKNIAEGKGKAQAEDTYEGIFKKGLPEGQGVYIFGADKTVSNYPYAKGDKYEGNFKKGVFDGKGKITFADPEKGVLDGYFLKGSYSGKTKEGFVVETKDGIVRVVVKQNGTSKNFISVRGLGYPTQIGRNHLEFAEDSGNSCYYEDIKGSAFPFTVHINGSAPNTGAKCELKVLIERPGTWSIDVYTN